MGVLRFLILLCLCRHLSLANIAMFDKITDRTFLGGRADVVFLLDRSGSVGLANFEIEKGFVESLLMHVAVDVNATRVAVISYSTVPKLHIDYIRNPKSKCFLAQDMQDVIFEDVAATDIAAALEEARKVLSYGRPSVNRVVILISDGMSTHGVDPVPVAKRLKDETGAELYAFGIGRFLHTQLSSMASSPDHMYICPGFKEFKKLAREIRGDPHENYFSKDTTQPNCDHLCTSPYLGTPDDPGCCDHHAQCSCALLSGMHTCVCQPGYYGLSGTWGKCRACPRGTYKSKLEPTSACTSCPPNAITAEQGSTSINDCYCESGYVKGTGPQLSCEIKKCPLLQNPANGILLGFCSNDYGAECHFLCNDGYELVNSNTDILTCQNNGLWSADLPVCRRVLCSKPLQPVYGKVYCSSQPLTVGTTCEFNCYNGFILQGSPVRECLSNGLWSGHIVKCQPVECPLPRPLLHGKITNCSPENKPKVDDTCIFYCNDGFQLIGSPFITCNSKGILIDAYTQAPYSSNMSRCQDVQKPQILCPTGKEIITLPKRKFAVVKWDDPTTYDNSGSRLKIQVNPPGLRSPAKFLIGTSVVTYKVIDAAGLHSSCDFTVTVIDNEPPLVLSCPSTIKLNTSELREQVFWEEPVFKDNSEQPVIVEKSHTSGQLFEIGHHRVHYFGSDVFGNAVTCEFEVIITENECPYYPAPVNGAFICEDWMYGQFCQAFCNVEFDFVTKPANWYICDYEAKWITDPIGYSVPWSDCYRRASPNGIRQMLHGFYYYGDCNDPRVQHAIKLAFLEHFMKKFSKHQYCTSIRGACTLDLVKINCGKTTDHHIQYLRKKRDTQQDRPKSKLDIEIDILIDIVKLKDDSSEDFFGDFQEAFNDFTWNITEELTTQLQNITDGSEMVPFEIPDGAIVFTSKEILPLCHIGSILVDNECRLCPPGTYHDQEKEKCSDCPIGFYGETEGQSECMPCLFGATTQDVHTINTTECRGICPAGTYSFNGLETCIACPIGTYQDKQQSMSCISCPNGTSTFSEGSTSSNDCSDYCAPGHFSDSGLEPCIPCAIGFYQTNKGQNTCNECLMSHTTVVSGSSSESACIEYNHCQNEHMCKNGGTCISVKHSINCVCSIGFSGIHCEADIDECVNSPCLNNAKCINTAGSFYCNCSQGFVDEFCDIERNECESNPCGANGTCIDQFDSYFCICKPGFAGPDCKETLDICFNGIICLNGGHCEDNEGHNRTCECADGFSGSDCSININDCLNVTCQNGGSCIDGLAEYHCACVDGFIGELCELSVNACYNHSCFNGSTCMPNMEKYNCHCPPGWNGSLCDKKMSEDFTLYFPKMLSLENMAYIKVTEVLPEITVSIWIQTNSNSSGTILSYAVVDVNQLIDNALTLTHDTDFTIYVNNQPLNIEVELSDNVWHHLVFTWSSLETGMWKFYKDGQLLFHGEDLALSSPIAKGGLLIVGQEQDDIAGGFNLLEAFSGNVTRLNIWKFVYSEDDVKQLYDLKDDLPGKVVAWSDFRKQIDGDVELVENELPLILPRLER